ncbi:MAG: hypothetical protein ABI605_17240 [Rhizobacter sp.]
MRTSIALASLGLLLATSAHAMPADAKKLAQFDVGYSQCEERFPDMKGHRDEAYLALWRVSADDKARAQLAAIRKGGTYEKARQAALRASPKKPGPEIEAKLKQQCAATWAEVKLNATPAKP